MNRKPIILDIEYQSPASPSLRVGGERPGERAPPKSLPHSRRLMLGPLSIWQQAGIKAQQVTSDGLGEGQLATLL
jgi:hypothetical protein